ncbi:MAG: hypothetical protein ACI837_002977 [Crocinitomicaceae bacterium]|jgi:hypothetical protein
MKSILITTVILLLSFMSMSQKEAITPSIAVGGCSPELTCGTGGGGFLNSNGFSSFDGKMTLGLSTLNLSSLGVSTIFMATGNRSNLPYIAGMSTGLAQTGYGIYQAVQLNRINYSNNGGDYFIQPYDPNTRRRAGINVGIGAVTTLINTFGLIRNIHLKKRDDLNWNVFGSQENDGSLSLGFNVIKRF